MSLTPENIVTQANTLMNTTGHCLFCKARQSFIYLPANDDIPGSIQRPFPLATCACCVQSFEYVNVGDYDTTFIRQIGVIPELAEARALYEVNGPGNNIGNPAAEPDLTDAVAPSG